MTFLLFGEASRVSPDIRSVGALPQSRVRRLNLSHVSADIETAIRHIVGDVVFSDNLNSTVDIHSELIAPVIKRIPDRAAPS